MNTHNEYISYWLRRFLLEYATTVIGNFVSSKIGKVKST